MRRARALAVAGSMVAVATPPMVAGTAHAIQAPIAFSAAASSTYQTNGFAWAVASAGNQVFVGGEFTSVRPPGAAPGQNEQARSNLVVLDAATGAPTSCAPAVTFNGASQGAAVRDLAVSPDGRTLYIAGSFTTVAGVAKQHLAALDIASCTLIANFSPLPNGAVRAVTASGASVYFGGTFAAVQGVGRVNAGAVSAVGTPTPGAVLPWAPRLDGELWAVAVRPGGSAVVIGGNFFTVNGSASHALAVVNHADGASVANYPGFIDDRSTVKDIAVDDSGFYTANEGTGGGVFDGRIALNWSNYQQRWRDGCLGATQAVKVFQGVLYSGSHAHECLSTGAFPEGPRHHLLAQSVNDPTLLSWFPDTDDGVNERIGPRDLVVANAGTSPVMYVVGEFTTVNGAPQQGITRFTSGPDTTAPSIPLPSVTSVTAGQARVAWRLSIDPDDRDLTYRVYRDGSATPLHTVSRSSMFWTQRQAAFTDTNLTPGATHSYRITASNGTLTTSSPSRSVVISGATSSYRNRVLADGASFLWRYDEPGDVFVADDSGNDANGQLQGSGAHLVQPGALTGDASRAFTINAGSTIHSVARYPAPGAFTAETWFRTTTTGGGKLLGFGNRQTGDSSSYDKHIYMGADGRLMFGVNNGSLVTVASPRAYNDGSWHHVAATQGPGGMVLYVDGAAVATAGATTSERFEGYWRAGGDNVNGWPNAVGGDFAGTLDETAVYPSALQASTVADHYALGIGRSAPPPPTAVSGSTYRPLDPRRLLDTRSGTGGFTGKVGPNGSLRLQVTGPAGSGLAPVGSTAVTLNVTATEPTEGGFVAVYPSGYAGGPNTSNLNFVPGQTTPNLVVSKVAGDGTVTLYNSNGSVHLIADLQGSYTPDTGGSTYRPLDPRRLLDSRSGTGGFTGKVGPNGSLRLQVTGPAGSGLAPVGSTAVTLNVTATEPTEGGFVAVYPSGYAGGPNTSNLNFVPGQTTPNLVVSKVAGDGTVTLYNSNGSVHLIADLQGSFGS